MDSYNLATSGVRVAVENVFGRVNQAFETTRILFLFNNTASPDLLYKVAVLLTNFKTCLEGNQVSVRFGVDPPTLEEYLEARQARDFFARR